MKVDTLTPGDTLHEFIVSRHGATRGSLLYAGPVEVVEIHPSKMHPSPAWVVVRTRAGAESRIYQRELDRRFRRKAPAAKEAP